MARSERTARAVLALSAPRAVTAPASSWSQSLRPALAGTGPLRLSTSIATSPSPWNTARQLTRDNYSYRESRPRGRRVRDEEGRA